MKTVLIIGSGISGMSCAIACAEKGMQVTLVSPFPSERAQSVMAAGGINAALDSDGAGDSVECHIADTLAGGCYLAGRDAVTGLCRTAGPIVRQLEGLGTVFNRNADGKIDQRSFGAQSFRRTCYCGASTGKQIVTALVMETRRYEAQGRIRRRLWTDFHSGLIRDGRCYGALLYDESTRALEAVYADAVVMATGGQNALFGKTTGSTQCDGYAAGRLYQQGAALKNLEFIQYHPTTLETAQKRMLISEAARGEGGRLYYEDGGRRVYFMEEQFGPKGNLMPRDVVSRCVDAAGRQVWLDVSFLGETEIERRIPEVRELCRKYGGIDICTQSIPVAPSVHFFMGGLAVKLNHETNIENLYAVGECASIYHGANRLGGNSLLAAIYSGQVAAESIAGRNSGAGADFSEFQRSESEKLERSFQSESRFPVMYIRDELAEQMRLRLGIVRTEEKLREGINDISYYLSIAESIRYDSSVLAYFNYSLPAILTLARATLKCAAFRTESRGAHWRSDCPGTKEDFAAATVITWDGGAETITLDKEGHYEH